MTRWILVVGIVLVALVAALAAWWLWRDARPDGVAPEGEAARAAEELREAARAIPPAGPPAPEGVATSVLDEPFSFGAGHRVRVVDYRPGLSVEQEGGAPALVVDGLRVEVCAGDEELIGGALAAAFALSYPSRAGGHQYRSGVAGVVAREPALSTRLSGETLPAGECREGWVAVPLGEGDDVDARPPAAILFDNTAYGFVPKEDRARHAWVLD
ncbi:MAG TPA: hypothetical protein VMT16_05620 [Thermoanaerobaculia bacterium]|nr:hypothetical protein [Thermoanaerobaculia bacterium]